MKKIFLILLIFISLNYIYSAEDIFYISTENIKIYNLNESEYIQSSFYNEGFEFSTGIEVYSGTDDARIYLDGKLYRSGIIFFNELNSGSHFLEIKKSGYKSYRTWVEVDNGQRYIFNIELKRDFGYLKITSNSDNFDIYVNGFLIKNNQALPTNTYIVKVKGFGYKEISRYITINDNFTTNEYFELEKVPFKVESISIDKKVFNPRSFGGFSKNSVYIGVNGPGEGLLTISNVYDEILFNQELNFIDWKTVVNIDADTFTNGLYIVTLSSDNGSNSVEFEVDTDLIERSTPVYRGFTGLVASPTAEMNSNPSTQLSLGIGSDFITPTTNFPFIYSSTINKFLKINAGFDITLNFQSNSSIIDLFTGVMFKSDIGPLLWAFNLNYDFCTNRDNSLDSNISTHNIILNLPLTLGLNNLFISLAPEYNISFTDDNIIGTGLGLHYDNQRFRTGISGRFDTIDFKELDLIYGVEAYYLIPKTTSYIGLVTEFNQDFNFDILLNFIIVN